MSNCNQELLSLAVGKNSRPKTIKFVSVIHCFSIMMVLNVYCKPMVCLEGFKEVMPLS
jgi:hypothetical protein